MPRLVPACQDVDLDPAQFQRFTTEHGTVTVDMADAETAWLLGWRPGQAASVTAVEDGGAVDTELVELAVTAAVASEIDDVETADSDAADGDADDGDALMEVDAEADGGDGESALVEVSVATMDYELLDDGSDYRTSYANGVKKKVKAKGKYTKLVEEEEPRLLPEHKETAPARNEAWHRIPVSPYEGIIGNTHLRLMPYVWLKRRFVVPLSVDGNGEWVRDGNAVLVPQALTEGVEV